MTLQIVVAGGMESMTNAPYLLPHARSGYRMGDGSLVDAMIHDGLWDAYNDFHMGAAAEMVAEKLGISRADQDAFAAESHARAAAATVQGVFRDEILPIQIPAAKKGEPARVFDADESIRPGTSVEILARLKPAFKEGGTVTAGNAPGLSDGAAALVVASDARARELDLKPIAVIRAQALSGRDPAWFSLAPIEAVRRVAAKAGWSLAEVDLFELNEAFAVQALAVMRDLELDPAKVNVHGGAVALGHPIGASGARVLVTLSTPSPGTAKIRASRRFASAAATPWRWLSNGSELPAGAVRYRTLVRASGHRIRFTIQIDHPVTPIASIIPTRPSLARYMLLSLCDGYRSA